MINRHFDDEKVQDIYNSEYAKELAKVDAQHDQSNNKPIMGLIFFAALIFSAGYYVFTRLL